MADARTDSRIGQILEKLIDVAVIKTAIILVFLKKKRTVENRRARMEQERLERGVRYDEPSVNRSSVSSACLRK
jgi:hypothetical protein